LLYKICRHVSFNPVVAGNGGVTGSHRVGDTEFRTNRLSRVNVFYGNAQSACTQVLYPLVATATVAILVDGNGGVFTNLYGLWGSFDPYRATYRDDRSCKYS
jgi:hypothetical protein